MWVSPSLENQQMQNLEWFREYTRILNKNGNKEKFELVEKIFVETYFEIIRDEMDPLYAMQKAKMVAFCFLILKQ
jgi:hypothetical protein